LNNTSTNNVVMTGTSFANIDADDLIDMQDATPSGAQANAKYYMHRTILSFIRKLIGTDGQYIYQRPSENLPATVWDKPVVTVEAMPSKLDSAEDTAFVLYGDLRQACIFGYKGEIRASQHDTGIIRNVAGNADINLLTTDRIAVRWIERVGFITILPSAVTRLTTGSASV
jgi:HK97 family phage major capsid protein